MLNNLPQMHLKLWKRVMQKTAEAIGHLIGNKIADRIRKASKTSPKKETDDKETHKERYISRRKIGNYW